MSMLLPPEPFEVDPAQVERHHWVSALVGILDRSFTLDETEQFFVVDIVGRLLDRLSIPDRGVADTLPAPVALEVHSGFFTVLLASAQDSYLRRGAGRAEDDDLVASVDAWRFAFITMLTTAYPDLDVYERIIASAVVDDLLVAVGLPDRAPKSLPDEVVSAARSGM